MVTHAASKARWSGHSESSTVANTTKSLLRACWAAVTTRSAMTVNTVRHAPLGRQSNLKLCSWKNDIYVVRSIGAVVCSGDELYNHMKRNRLFLVLHPARSAI